MTPLHQRWLLALLLPLCCVAPVAAQPSANSFAACADAATPAALPAAPTQSEIDARIAAMPLEVKIGQMLMAGVTGTTADADARAMIDDLHVGNVILMGRNVDSPPQVLALTQGLQQFAQASNGVGAIIATDQEGGLVQRLHYVDGFTAMPMAETVGLARCPAVVRAYGRMVGAELAAVGVNMDMAPDLDVDTNPTNPVIGALGRSFGPTPEQVEAAAIPFMQGLHDAGVMATGKHFPGHGATTADSHLDLPYVDESRETLETIDIAPFRAAIAHGIDGVMPAHVVYPALDPSGLPATVSQPIQTGILRGELGFDGLIVTDDLGMKGITDLFPPEVAGVRAVEAGADILLCVRIDSESSCGQEMIRPLRDGLLAAVRSGKIPEARIDASLPRILTAKARYAVGPASGVGLELVGGGGHLQTVVDLLHIVADRMQANDRS
ncbi:MAG TPA: beta-N-acetylhexosaminidase, partial [Thermomicrobiales bacterium]|nr:beta-N-acetylhexosaminidase [Thermomicrobiales bacterium]